MVKPTLLITGSNGVLGNAFKRNIFLLEEYNVFFSSGREFDLTDPISTKKLFDKVSPDFVFHLAAKSGGIGLSKDNQATLLRDNLLMTINVADNCILKNVKKAIFTLSVGMYPENAILPIKETSNLTGKPHASNTGYAYAKAFIDPLIKSYNQEYKSNFIGLVPNGIYGPEDNFDPEHASMLPSLIRKAYIAKVEQTNLDVWGDGTPLRQYTYADDYVHIYNWCLKNYEEEGIINVGTSEERSIDTIANYICNSMGLESSKINYLTDKPKGIFRRPMDNTKFINISGFKFTKLSEGIDLTCKWVKKNSELLKTKSKN
tara:strand:+ start:7733 stop:8683 length:951 start_codon:yes stop_codon:yes gene_type:complete